MKFTSITSGTLAGLLLRFRKEFFWVGIFSMVVNLLMLTPTVYLLQLFDRVFSSRSELTLLIVTLLMVLFYAVMAVAEWLRSRLLVRGGVRLDDALHGLVFDAAFRKSLQPGGTAQIEALDDLSSIRQFLTGPGIFAFFDMPWTPIYMAFIFLLDPLLGWLSILFAGIQLAIAWSNHSVTVREIEHAEETFRASRTFFEGKLRNVESIHAMGMRRGLRQRWLCLHRNANDASRNMGHLQHRQQAFAKFVRYCMQSLTLAAGAMMVIEGRMSPGGMIAVNVLMTRALQPLDLVISVWRPFVHAYDAFGRLEALMECRTIEAIGGSRPDLDGDIRVSGLVAMVEGREKPVLDRIDFDIPKGTVVAVVGPSGSGKSTLARCLVGAWPEARGKVLGNGRSIGVMNREAIGPHIGYLPQEVQLFDGTVAENIARFGRIDAAAVIDAAKRTGIHDMVLRFPDGYDTRIGDTEGILSGGQRQRIGLARALYGDPSFIVLDEPNANLDEAGERSLAQAVRDLKSRGKTVVLVTHRPNILEAADRMLVLKNGHIESYGLLHKAIEKTVHDESTRFVQTQAALDNGWGKRVN